MQTAELVEPCNKVVHRSIWASYSHELALKNMLSHKFVGKDSKL